MQNDVDTEFLMGTVCPSSNSRCAHFVCSSDPQRGAGVVTPERGAGATTPVQDGPLALPPDILRCASEDATTPAGMGLGESPRSRTLSSDLAATSNVFFSPSVQIQEVYNESTFGS